jgi:hypothetical protein
MSKSTEDLISEFLSQGGKIKQAAVGEYVSTFRMKAAAEKRYDRRGRLRGPRSVRVRIKKL